MILHVCPVPYTKFPMLWVNMDNVANIGSIQNIPSIANHTNAASIDNIANIEKLLILWTLLALLPLLKMRWCLLVPLLFFLVMDSMPVGFLLFHSEL